MKPLYLRSLLCLMMATAFLSSCSKVDKDEIKPTSTSNTNAAARIDGVLYDQSDPSAPENRFDGFVIGRGPVVLADDFVVPEGETWTLDKIVYYSALENTELTLIIYANNGGQPGKILFTFTNPPLEVLETFGGGFTGSVYVMQADIANTQLKEGTYFVGFGYSNDYAIFFHNPMVGFPVFFAGTDYPPLSHSLDFQLLGSVVTETTIEDVLNTFNTGVAAGTITGAGKGKTAANNLNAFKNMLNNAKALLAANDLAGACTQLTDAQKRIHTGGKVRPDHFITGSSAGALHELITKLKTDLGCL